MPKPHSFSTETSEPSPSIKNYKGLSSLHDAVNLPVNPSVAQIVEYWLSSRQAEVKKNTWKCYRQQAQLYVVGPLLPGSKVERFQFARKGAKVHGVQPIDMLGPVPVSELTTAQIRQWHRMLCAHVSPVTARVAKKHLRSALALAAEDFDLRVPMMPSHRGRGIASPKKVILAPAQVGQLLQAAIGDEPKGIYYAFPFLTGVRPSEQLALLWDDIDMHDDNIRVRRVQESDGSLSELTKTVAGMRDIPMSPLLKRMLGRWQLLCPSKDGLPNRVFPALGWLGSPTHKKRGGSLSYNNFLVHYWRPAFARLALPYVTPHSARHAFISTLQASGIEIGLVAKLAGHADPAITLSHYTQAIRGGTAAVRALEEVYVDATKHCYWNGD